MPYLAVGIGGFLGACTRYLLSEWFGSLHGFPIATLTINLLGSFVLAWFYTITIERLPVHPHFRMGLGTGFIGAFTTFSTLTVELWSLVHAGLTLFAVSYFICTFAGGIVFAGGGYLLAMRQSRLRVMDESKEAD